MAGGLDESDRPRGNGLDPRIAGVPTRELMAWLRDQPAAPAETATAVLPDPVEAPAPVAVAVAAEADHWAMSNNWTMPNRHTVLRRPNFTVSAVMTPIGVRTVPAVDSPEPTAPVSTPASAPPSPQAPPPIALPPSISFPAARQAPARAPSASRPGVAQRADERVSEDRDRPDMPYRMLFDEYDAPMAAPALPSLRSGWAAGWRRAMMVAAVVLAAGGATAIVLLELGP